MKRLSLVFCGLTVILSASLSFAEKCTYTIDSEKTKVEWTAFKTTEKAAVKGAFLKVTVKSKKKASSLHALMKGAKVSIDTTSVETQNPVRNTNIVDGFFKKIAGKNSIQAKVISLDDAAEGKAKVRITLNGIKKEKEFTFVRKESGEVSFNSSFSILEFKADAALASLNELCRELHKGKDGISKTWPDVEVQVTVSTQKTCH